MNKVKAFLVAVVIALFSLLQRSKQQSLAKELDSTKAAFEKSKDVQQAKVKAEEENKNAKVTRTGRFGTSDRLRK